MPAKDRSRRHAHEPPFEIGQAATLGNDLPFVLIAGPCQPSRAGTMPGDAGSHGRLKAITADLGLIYKSSYDKANRTSRHARAGSAWTKGLPILAEVREDVRLPGADRRP